MEVGGVKGTCLSCWVGLPNSAPQVRLQPLPPEGTCSSYDKEAEPKDARTGGVRAVCPPSSRANCVPIGQEAKWKVVDGSFN